MYIFIALAGFLVLAVVSILDKFILERKLSPITFTFYATVFALPVALLLFFGVKFPGSLLDWFLVTFSGFCFCLAVWTSYIGLKKSELSHFGPFLGAVVPFFVVGLSWIFLGERLDQRDWLGIAILIAGSLFISFEITKERSGFNGALRWGILAGLLSAVSQVAAKYIYTTYGFWSGFVWARGAMIGLFGVLLLLSPIVRKEVFGKKEEINPVASEKGKLGGGFAIVAVNKVLGVVGIVLVQYAVALGSVSVVNALNGVQYAILIILVGFLSKFRLGVFREYYTRGEKIQEALSVIIIMFGLALLI